MAKRPHKAAEVLAHAAGPHEGLELVVTHMVNAPPSMQKMNFIMNFVRQFERFATPEQRISILKLYDLGWDLGKVVWNEAEKKIAWSVRSSDTAAWVTPDGKLHRSPVGKKTATLPGNWTSSEGE